MVVIPQPLSWDTAFVLNFNSDAACDHVLIINAEGRAFLRPDGSFETSLGGACRGSGLIISAEPLAFPLKTR